MQRVAVSPPLANTCCIQFFLATLGVKWYLLILLTCISLMTDGTEHLYVTFKKVNRIMLLETLHWLPFTLGIQPRLLPLALKPPHLLLPFLP